MKKTAGMRSLAALLWAAGCTGCAFSLDRTPPLLGTDDVLAMHRAGVPSEVIAAKVSVSRVAGPLSVLEMVRLKEQGIDDRLLERLVAASAGNDRAVYYPARDGPYPAGEVGEADSRVPTAHPDGVHRRRVDAVE